MLEKRETIAGVSIMLDVSLLAKIDTLAQKLNRSRSDVVRLILREYFNKEQKNEPNKYSDK